MASTPDAPKPKFETGITVWVPYEDGTNYEARVRTLPGARAASQARGRPPRGARCGGPHARARAQIVKRDTYTHQDEHGNNVLSWKYQVHYMVRRHTRRPPAQPSCWSAQPDRPLAFHVQSPLTSLPSQRTRAGHDFTIHSRYLQDRLRPVHDMAPGCNHSSKRYHS